MVYVKVSFLFLPGAVKSGPGSCNSRSFPASYGHGESARFKIGGGDSAVRSRALGEPDASAIERQSSGPRGLPPSWSASPHAVKSSMLRGRSQSLDGATLYGWPIRSRPLGEGFDRNSCNESFTEDLALGCKYFPRRSAAYKPASHLENEKSEAVTSQALSKSAR